MKKGKISSENPYIKGRCFICFQECEKEGMVHRACAVAYDDAKKNRIKKLMEKYGDGLRFQKILVSGEDIES